VRVAEAQAFQFRASNERFRLIGEHEGFPVYQEKSGNHNQIRVTLVNGGPVAP